MKIKLLINNSTIQYTVKYVEKILKDILRKDFCENCGLKQEEDFEKFHIHHCFEARNTFDRLNYTSFITLCPSCHYKTQQMPNLGGWGSMEKLTEFRQHIASLLTGEVFKKETHSLDFLKNKISLLLEKK